MREFTEKLRTEPLQRFSKLDYIFNIEPKPKKRKFRIREAKKQEVAREPNLDNVIEKVFQD